MPDCTGFLNATASHWLEALARSSWQGGAALLLAWLVSRTAPRLPASMQCWLWRLAWLKLLVALFWVTPVDVPLPMGSALPIARPRGPATPTAHAPLRPAVTAVPTATAAPVEIPSYHPLPSTPPAAPPPLGSAAYLLLAWTACVALLLARMARERNRARALLARCTPTRDTALLTWLEELARKLGMSQRPAVLELEALASPLLIAGRPPVVVLPTALLHSCSEAECRLMLAHELAHVQRRDLAWGWLVAASQVLFFFHPVVWLARRESSLAQEAACDRIAVAVVEAGTATYGELLLKVAAIPNRGFQPGLVPLGGTDQSIHALRRRLKMLQRLQTASRSKRTGEGAWGRSAGLATLVLLGVTIVVPWRVTAQERAVDVSPPATQADAPAPGGSPEGVEPDVPASPDGPEGPNAPALPKTSLASQPVPESTGSDLAAGSLSAAAEQWEDVLLLEAMRYLRLSGDQVAQVRALSRPTDERLSKLRDDEKRTLAALERIARRNREALLAGSPGRQQEDALLLKRISQQKRARIEQELLEWLMPRVTKSLTREQMVRAILLTLGEPVRDRDRVFGTALLDPAAGFVLADRSSDPEVRPGQQVRSRVGEVRSRWDQRRDEQLRQSLAQKYPAEILDRLQQPLEFAAKFTELFYVNNAATITIGPKVGLGGTFNVTPPTSTDPQLQAAQRDLEALRGRAQASTGQLLTMEATPEELQDALRPFVRRFMLSPRLHALLEERRK